MNCLGVDLSSKAIDLVLVDENHDTASHTRIELAGDRAFDRARDIARQMPSDSWFVLNDVYLIALERPFVRRGQDVIRLVQGAVLACLPRRMEVWEVSPSQWKNRLGLRMRDKPTAANFPTFGAEHGDLAYWPQDALDALGVAVYARDVNADGIAAALGVAS